MQHLSVLQYVRHHTRSRKDLQEAATSVYSQVTTRAKLFGHFSVPTHPFLAV